MGDNRIKRKSIWPRYTVSAFVIIAAFLLFLGLGLFEGLVTAQGDPVLEMSSSFNGKPLLGAQQHCL